MSQERMMILEMLANGKITPDDAQILLRALGDPVDEPSGPQDLHSPDPLWPEGLDQTGMPIPPAVPAAPPAAAAAPAPVPQPRGVFDTLARAFSGPPASPAPPAPPARDRRRRYPDPSYAVAMKRAGLDFSIEQLLRMKEQDVEPEQAIQMAQARRPNWSTDDVVDVLVAGACPDLLNKLNLLGFEPLTPHDLIAMTENDVDVAYVERFHGLEITGLTPRDLIAFAEHDVEPQLVSALREIGPVTIAEIIHAAENDLSPDFARQAAQAWPNLSIRQLIELSEHDVTPEWIAALRRAGFTDLTVKQALKLQDNDVDGDDAAWFRQQFGPQVTPDALLRLAHHDVSRDYAASLLETGLAGLTIDAMVQMVDNDVTGEDARQALELYGAELTADDLIEIARHR